MDPPPNKTKGREFDFCCMEFSWKSGVLTQNISSMEAEPRKGFWNFCGLPLKRGFAFGCFNNSASSLPVKLKTLFLSSSLVDGTRTIEQILIQEYFLEAFSNWHQME